MGEHVRRRDLRTAILPCVLFTSLDLLSLWSKGSFYYYHARLWEGGALRQFLESIVTTRAFGRLERRPRLNTANMCGEAVYYWQRYLVQWLKYCSFARTSKDVA
jgi:hypothetical protein